jgi:murein DD-endopeptidase MepM/ murein hydrolase activator NlpD
VCQAGRAVTRVAVIPLRTIGSAVASAGSLPLTATAVVACLVVTVATPQQAMASTDGTGALAVAAQDFTAPGAAAIAVTRDGFSVTRDGFRGASSTVTTEPLGATDAVRPVAGSIPAAGGFGARWVRGCGACSTNHLGLDFAAPTGTPALAVMPGRVVSAGVFGGYGNQVLLQHADGTQTRYGHLSEIAVRVGQTVAAGERVGAVGSTGVSTGSHLHFEVIIGSRPVDPAVWLGVRGLL